MKIQHEQMNLFDFGCEPYRPKGKELYLISLFSGYDAQALGIKYLFEGTEYKMIHHKTCEWATKSIQALYDCHFGDDTTDYSKDLTDEQVYDYLAERNISYDYNVPLTREEIVKKFKGQKARNIYNQIKAEHNMVSVTKATGQDLEIDDNRIKTFLLTYSFPCQDLSLSGELKGMERGSGTRSGMLWEVERILDECYDMNPNTLQHLPNILILENVPNLIGKQNVRWMGEWVSKLEKLGYQNFFNKSSDNFGCMNGKDYGIPQNRNRMFMISILFKNEEFSYEFPKPFGRELCLQDLLEENVDEEYYLTRPFIEYCMDESKIKFPRKERFLQNVNRKEQDVANCLTTNNGSRPTDTFILEKPSFDEVYGRIKNSKFAQKKNQIQEGEVCDTLLARDFKDPKCIIERLDTSNKRVLDTVEKNIDNLKDGTYIDAYNQSINEECANTITTGVDSRSLSFVCVKDNRGGYSIRIPEATKKGYLLARKGDGVDLAANRGNHRGTVQKGMAQTLKTSPDVGVVVSLKRGYDIKVKEPSKTIVDGVDELGSYQKGGFDQCKIVGKKGISPTFTENHGEVVAVADYEQEIEEGFEMLAIRKLTPRECGRLMSVKDEDISKIIKNQSKSSAYHLFGDSLLPVIIMALVGNVYGIDWKSKINNFNGWWSNEDNHIDEVEEDEPMYTGTLDNYEKPILERLDRNIKAFAQCMKDKGIKIERVRKLYQTNLKGDGKRLSQVFFYLEGNESYLVDDTSMIKWNSEFDCVDIKESAMPMLHYWGITDN